jgi:hypothetical protein
MTQPDTEETPEQINAELLEACELQEVLKRDIKASPVIATCEECGGDIREGEVENGLSDGRECAQCVRDEVLSMIGDF